MKSSVSIHSLKYSDDVARSVHKSVSPKPIITKDELLERKLSVVDSYMAMVKAIPRFSELIYSPVIQDSNLISVEMYLRTQKEIAYTNYSSEGQLIVDLTKAFQNFI